MRKYTAPTETKDVRTFGVFFAFKVLAANISATIVQLKSIRCYIYMPLRCTLVLTCRLAIIKQYYLQSKCVILHDHFSENNLRDKLSTFHLLFSNTVTGALHSRATANDIFNTKVQLTNTINKTLEYVLKNMII